ncbi:uncharacterized protein LOC111392480 [Olea europaea var. sylvestris]|uniref:uncharacterized protein LOC111392480 n=1 Tax=Olea europaea var. sylvestris TaxID=158386 RepID=UPI000C1D07FD|nr:uncharacterized protein LOC111392480 [Olea europaea var. sylvestris]
MYWAELECKNPGSKINVKKDSDGHVKYAFMSLGASIQGWRYCKPGMVVYATFLTWRYDRSLFTACTQDVNNSIFILAFGIGDSKNNDSWSWFLNCLNETFRVRDGICIISNRHQSIEYMVNTIFTGVHHSFCTHHILQNLRTAYGNSTSEITKMEYEKSWRGSHSYCKCDDYMNLFISNIYAILVKIGYEKGSRTLSLTNRYDIMTTNILEPIHGSRRTKVSTSNENLYQVSDENMQHVVDLYMMTCTCNRFQKDGVQCQYGLATIDNYRCHGEILPSISKRQSGRFKKARRRTRVEMSNPTRCRKCGGLDHNRRTYKQPWKNLSNYSHSRIACIKIVCHPIDRVVDNIFDKLNDIQTAVMAAKYENSECGLHCTLHAGSTDIFSMKTYASAYMYITK